MTVVILLFVAGVSLLFAEFFLPGLTMGILGAILVLASIIIGWRTYPEYGVFILAGELTGVVAVMGAGLYIMMKTPLGNRLVLQARQDTDKGFASYAQDASLVGKAAVVHTALRPAGSIMIENRRIDAVSNGTFIDAGMTVRIIKVEGNRVVCDAASGAGA